MMPPHPSSNTKKLRAFSPGTPEHRHLDRLLAGLWDGDQLAREAPATLSRWRRGLGKRHEETPYLSMEVAEILQDATRPEDRMPQEAVFQTLTLYALHQQSVSTRMHTRARERYRYGTSIGHALRDLSMHNASSPPATSADGEAGEDGDKPSQPWNHPKNRGLLRLLDATVTAHSVPELVGHLRHVVSLLRKGTIPLDYARLAHDVHAWSTSHRSRVARRWAMDFYTPLHKNEQTDTEES